MSACFERLFRSEEGQDIVEYSLLLAFIAVCSIAFLTLNRDAIAGVATTTNSNLSAAQAIAAGHH